MKIKVNLDTMQNIYDFVKICTSINEEIHLTNGKDFRVSAKSLIGAIATMDWNEVYAESDKDISFALRNFTID